jgi:hypothetical protein
MISKEVFITIQEVQVTKQVSVRFLFCPDSGMCQSWTESRTSISEHAFYDSLARFPPPRCYPETCVDVLQKIADWIDDQDPSQKIFWLNGPAGAGKTAITQTIAKRCKDTQLATSFFFQRKTSDRGVANRLFLTLAWQLAIVHTGNTFIPRIYTKGGAFNSCQIH